MPDHRNPVLQRIAHLLTQFCFQTSSRLLQLISRKRENTPALGASGLDSTQPSLATVQKLNQQATAKLSEVVRKSFPGDKAGYSYDQAEVIAARELLDRDKQFVER